MCYKEANAFNRKLNTIIEPCEHTAQLNLNMQRQHFTKHGMHMNGSIVVRIGSQGFLHQESWNYLLLITMERPLPFPGRLKP
jgi:hypothetical protein